MHKLISRAARAEIRNSLSPFFIGLLTSKVSSFVCFHCLIAIFFKAISHIKRSWSTAKNLLHRIGIYVKQYINRLNWSRNNQLNWIWTTDVARGRTWCISLSSKEIVSHYKSSQNIWLAFISLKEFPFEICVWLST